MAGMIIFETVKQVVHPQISIWQSHIVTILFSTMVAVAAGTLVLRRIHAAHRAAVLEMKRAERERAVRLASLGTLATGLAHEMKNPLAAILTSAQAALILKDKASHGEKLAKSLQNMVDSATRCNEIVDKLRVFAGGQSTEKKPCDLNEIVRSAAESSRTSCASDHAHIELAVQRNLPPVPMNAVGIELLLVNLIHNAAQAGEAVQITIRTEQTRDGVRLTVEDNGRGINEDAKRRAFEPFFSTRHDQGGMGLGLSIAHGIVADHNGSIHIDGEPGKGTTVTVELPIATPDRANSK
jgi:signal transduction histidine kinase